jgi:hypothetical protein
MTSTRSKHADPPTDEKPLANVEALLADMPRLFSGALLAHVRHAPDAAVKTREALNAIETARAELRRVDAEMDK